MSSMHGELPAEAAHSNMLMWSRLSFRHFQAEAASTSLPMSLAWWGSPSSMLRTKLMLSPSWYATSLEQTAACSTHSCLEQRSACHAVPKTLSTAQLHCCSCQPACLTSWHHATLPVAPQPGRKARPQAAWASEAVMGTHCLSSGSGVTEWLARSTSLGLAADSAMWRGAGCPRTCRGQPPSWPRLMGCWLDWQWLTW